ncbi:pentatricopeptide repeat-containing protein At2g22410, mitochondrial-like [Telopea speciosissima]|uniref:pentatricopeptide repeat-containing protein At2g22410, mitochondrial-like n=1 Tax=Telopea speciosissima TaxID=54955 RepID=UPI001CC3419A|nr:pentatricopeptide repeat-containing protein At2g22410, mitochondrial-like [Telopea speciosissima]
MVVPLKCVAVGSRLNYCFLVSCTSHFRSIGSPPKTNSDHKFKSATHQNLHSHLEKCSTMGELKQIHAQIIENGLFQENFTVGKVIAFCAISEMGDLQYARFVFDRTAEHNRFMWNSLIRGYSNRNDTKEVLFLYGRMIGSGLSPNEFTLPFVLKGCACELAFMEAKTIHGQALKLGIGSHVCVQNALLNAYALCGSIHGARSLFDIISERTLVSWNSMIGGYSRMGFCKEAFSLFREMRDLSFEPDEFTWVNLLSVCSQNGNFDLGRFVHSYIVVTGSKIDLFVRNALVDMYAKCGHLQSAQAFFDRMPHKNVVSWTCIVNAYARHGLLNLARQVFNQMPEKNIVSWNSMISCCVQHNRCREALDLFTQMCNSRLDPDEATLVSILGACSQLGDLVMGTKTHVYLCNSSVLPSVTLYNSLIDMYAKCGPIDTAFDIFRRMPERNVVSWNVMIGAFAMHGYGLDAIKLFGKMQHERVPPDEVTFVGVLSACSHSGFVDIGRRYFNSMSLVYAVQPEIEHYACMVDLLGRGGHLSEAIKLIGVMPVKPDIVVWGALLGACRIYGDVEIGRQVLKQLLELEPHSGGLYVLISNIYCEAQRWEEMKKVRKLMKDKGINKGKALSLIEIDGHIHEFMVEDKRHVLSSKIYSMIEQLTSHLRSIGYLCCTSRAFLDVEEM